MWGYDLPPDLSLDWYPITSPVWDSALVYRLTPASLVQCWSTDHRASVHHVDVMIMRKIEIAIDGYGNNMTHPCEQHIALYTSIPSSLPCLLVISTCSPKHGPCGYLSNYRQVEDIIDWLNFVRRNYYFPFFNYFFNSLASQRVFSKVDWNIKTEAYEFRKIVTKLWETEILTEIY